LNEELINKEKLHSRFEPENLVQNTVIVNHQKGSKLFDFLEETIFKR